MNAAHLPPRLALAAVLERDALERRERRLELVVRELRVRAEARRTRIGHVPAPLRRALDDFQSELREVRSRLRRDRPARRPRPT